ncbi:hypothetical protein HELRODRAFT_180735 [Helobdella robusta]|uniref:Apple domain-containing protein n=1 Tax=Helobdella robusta TaxID=6412 RepID=T1FG79_HELRO|nr:hypothetical protein HELRODRAFT_180735 [Helobdella robusta]ESN93644.1 hypothetical protein HELRODRAFT_180735 [Helobdella robusta]
MVRIFIFVLFACLSKSVHSQGCSRTPNTIAYGGSPQPGINTIDSCEASCLASTATCKGIVFDPLALPPCYFLVNSNPTTQSGKTGITWHKSKSYATITKI